MEVITLIVTILALIISGVQAYYFLKRKIGKRYIFALDYKNITFASFCDYNNPHLNERLCLVVYGINVTNRSEEANTLRSITFSYKFNGKSSTIDSYVVPTGTISNDNLNAIILTNGEANIVLVGWENVRTKLANFGLLQPGGVFSGCAIFLIDESIAVARSLQNMKLSVLDFYGNKSAYPITAEEKWFDALEHGFAVANKSFTIDPNNIVHWN